MTKPFPFEEETFDIIFNPVSNVYIEDFGKPCIKKPPVVLKRGDCLMSDL